MHGTYLVNTVDKHAAPRNIVTRYSDLLEHEWCSLGILLAFMLINLSANWIFPGGYESDPVMTCMAVFACVWTLGFAVCLAKPKLSFCYFLMAMSLLSALALQGALATAAITPFTGEFIDTKLALADRSIMPLISWPEMIQWLQTKPGLFRSLNYIYLSPNYQTPLLLLILSATGRLREAKAMVAATAIALLAALPIYAAMPALGAYAHYGMTAGDVPNLIVDLPFQFPQTLQHLKDGTATTLSIHEITGLISFPSFHAVGAVILAMNWRHIRYLAVPGILLNIAVILAAMPIGSHYLCDIISGSLLGYGAMKLANYLINKPQKPSHETSNLAAAQ